MKISFLFFSFLFVVLFTFGCQKTQTLDNPAPEAETPTVTAPTANEGIETIEDDIGDIDDLDTDDIDSLSNDLDADF